MRKAIVKGNPFAQKVSHLKSETAYLQARRELRQISFREKARANKRREQFVLIYQD